MDKSTVLLTALSAAAHKLCLSYDILTAHTQVHTSTKGCLLWGDFRVILVFLLFTTVLNICMTLHN